MAFSIGDQAFNPAPAPNNGLSFGGGVTDYYDQFKTGVVGNGGGGGLTFGTTTTGFNPFDFTTGPAITGLDVLQPTVSFGGPPEAPSGNGGFGLINSLIAGIGGFTGGGNVPIAQPTPAVSGPPSGAQVAPVTTDGGVGFLDQLLVAAGGLLNGMGAQADTIEVTPVLANPEIGAGADTKFMIGLGIAAAVAYFALKK